MNRSADKIFALDALLDRVGTERGKGRTIALANGLFDILHVGHLRYLEAASSEADVLLVGVNSDRSARELKGPTRPIVPELERAELVAGFDCVDLVTVFDGPTVEGLLRSCRPHVHCKGTDYTAETVPEAAVASELGVRIVICGDDKRHSSRDIITRMKNGN